VYYQDFFKDAPGEAVNGFSGLTFARDVSDSLSLEGLAGRGYWNGRDRDTGWQFMFLGRYSLRLGAAAVHAISIAAGPSIAVGGDYGFVPFVQSEVAYELRARGGFNLVLGGGPGLPLASSRDPGVFCRTTEKLCDYFHRGNVGGRVRLGLGWSF
jgi:hypothetical protein